MLKKQIEEVFKMKWRPKFGRAKHPKRDRMRSWKAFGEDKKNPVFEVAVHKGDVFSNHRPKIEATKYHIGGIGSVWEFDLEAVDKLIVMLLTARAALVERIKHPDDGN